MLDKNMKKNKTKNIDAQIKELKIASSEGDSAPRMPANLRKNLLDNPKALASWADITPISRRDWILWITSAKQEETSTRRISKACSMLKSGKRRVCCFGGIKWLKKMNEAKKEMK